MFLEKEQSLKNRKVEYNLISIWLSLDFIDNLDVIDNLNKIEIIYLQLVAKGTQ